MKINSSCLMNAAAILSLCLFGSGSVQALDVNITQDLPFYDVHHGDDLVRVQRNQDQSNVLKGGYTKTSRKCPPFCIQPLQVAPGVTTVGELEVLAFIDKKYEAGTGVVIDARTPSWHEKGTIPSSVNIPFTNFDKDKSDAVHGAALAKLGVVKKGAQGGSILDSIKNLFGGDSAAANSPWNFSNAKDVLLWCNGMWCGQSPRAIRGLLALGYPPAKIFYYRGGMQAWQSLGLTVVVPK